MSKNTFFIIIIGDRQKGGATMGRVGDGKRLNNINTFLAVMISSRSDYRTPEIMLLKGIHPLKLKLSVIAFQLVSNI